MSAILPDRGANSMNTYNTPWWGWLGIMLVAIALVFVIGAMTGMEDPTPYKPAPSTTTTGTDR